MTKMCLEKAVRDGHTSLSFPALGTGVYDYSGAASAKGLFNAIMEFFDTNKQLEKIGIVLFDGARGLVVEVLIDKYLLISILPIYCTIISLAKRGI